jgi:hypothetical protein
MFNLVVPLLSVFVGVQYLRTRNAPPREPTTNMPRLINRRGGKILVNGRDNSSEPKQPSSGGGDDTAFVDPGLEDVIAVKALLKQAGNVPDELVNMILDEAEYWPCSSTTAEFGAQYLAIRARTDYENRLVVRTEPLGMTRWAPDDEDAWHQPAPPLPLQAEYSHEELERYRDGKVPATLTNPCRKIVFHFESNDQGWGGAPGDKGTYSGSWTWFDAGLERFDAQPLTPEPQGGEGEGEGEGGSEREAKNDGAFSSEKQQQQQQQEKKNTDIPVSVLRPLWPRVMQDDDGPPFYHHELLPSEDHKIQCNKTAVREPQTHVVEWRYTDNTDPESEAAKELEANGRGKATGTGEFVRDMKFGDVVTVWGKARFAGWENRVKKVDVKVYWAV